MTAKRFYYSKYWYTHELVYKMCYNFYEHGQKLLYTLIHTTHLPEVNYRVVRNKQS